MLRAALVRSLAECPIALVCLVAVAVFVWFGADEGGYAPTTWYPGGLLLLGLLAVAAIAIPLPRPPRALVAAVGLLVAYAAWSYLSIAWAGQKADALEGANRTLLYAIVFALFALWPIRERAGAVLLGAFGLGVGAIGLVELLRADAAAQPLAYFLEGRFSEPVGYSNANVALLFMGFWPCAALAARREVHPLLRGLFLGSAGLLAGMALMAQSRGWLFVLPLTLIVFVAVMPNRGRLIAALAGVGAAAAFMARPVLDVANEYRPGDDIGPLVHDAAEAIFRGSAVLAIVGLAVALLDRRVELPVATARRVSAATVAALVAACALAVAGYTAREGDPLAKLNDKWTQFKQGGETPTAGANRLTTVSTYRYDFWRVAWGNFRRHPVAGVGADNFGRDYRLRGRSYQEPRFPHSVELRTLSETGVVGALLLGGSIGCALLLVAGGLRRRLRPTLGGAVAGAGAATFIYWLAHGSLDWFWEFVGLGAPAFALLGLAVAVVRAGPGDAPERPGWLAERLPQRALAIPLIVTGLICTAAFALPWLSERDLERASKSWRVDPSGATSRLDQAASLNPLSARPYLAAGTYALRLGDRRTAERRFRQALERDSRDAYALMHLGALASVSGHRDEALRLLEQAARENPRKELAVASLRALRRGKRLGPEALNRRIVRDSRVRLGLPG